MSRLDDLIDLIQTTNEVYFITAPGRVRTAYILVDDIVELALKTFLQVQTLQRRADCLTALEAASIVQTERHRRQFRLYCEEDIDFTGLCAGLGQSGAVAQANVQSIITPFEPLHHWSANNPDERKDFDEVVHDVKTLPAQPTLSPATVSLLDDVFARHKTRNKFYHDHHSSGLTIDDDKCLRALCDLFTLMEGLFTDFRARIQQYKTVRCQIGVLRLKLAAHGSTELTKPYLEALQQIKTNHQFDLDPRSVEHNILHTVSERFFVALSERFSNEIAELEDRITRIDGMSPAHQKQRRAERSDKAQVVAMLRQQLSDFASLLGTP